MRPRRAAACLLWTGAVLGCGAEEPPASGRDGAPPPADAQPREAGPTVDAGSAWVEVGQRTAEGGYQALRATDTVGVATGPQGGTMVVLVVRAGGVTPGSPDQLDDPANPETTCRISRNGTLLALAQEKRGLSGVGPDTFELPSPYPTGTWIIFFPEIDRTIYVGQTVQITVEVLDAQGRRPTSTVEVALAALR